MPTVQMAVPASSSPYMSSATAKRAHIRARFIHNTDSLGSPSTLLQPLSRAHETIPISWWWRKTYGAHLVRRVHSLPLCTLSSIFTARVSRVVRTKSCAPPPAVAAPPCGRAACGVGLRRGCRGGNAPGTEPAAESEPPMLACSMWPCMAWSNCGCARTTSMCLGSTRARAVVSNSLSTR